VAKSVLGSCVTNMCEKLCGLNGRVLALTEGYSVKSVSDVANASRRMQERLIPDFNTDYQSAVFLGFKFALFAFGER